MNRNLEPARNFRGNVELAGDKSISHRALLFGAMSEGTTEITNLSESQDVRTTRECLEAMGIEFSQISAKWRVHGKGLHGLRAPSRILDCGNSGTTIRLLMGILSGQPFSSTLTGDESLRKRPMERVAGPLREMGAEIGLSPGGFAPLTIRGCPLRPIDYSLKIPSAQIKSALLLAGLYADGRTTLTGEIASRDHTERMLPHFGARLESTERSLSIEGGQSLRGANLRVPGDISSAAFWLAAAALIPKSDVEVRGVSLNPTRTGFLNVLNRMGCAIETETTVSHPEPTGNLRVRHHPLRGTKIEPSEVASLIDELPILAVLGAFAEGVTEVRGASELRVKESDRIEAIARNLRAMGATIETFPDGFRIQGGRPLQGATIDSYLDHRIAMAFSIAALAARGNTMILNSDCAGVSYPSFYETLERLQIG